MSFLSSYTSPHSHQTGALASKALAIPTQMNGGADSGAATSTSNSTETAKNSNPLLAARPPHSALRFAAGVDAASLSGRLPTAPSNQPDMNSLYSMYGAQAALQAALANPGAGSHPLSNIYPGIAGFDPAIFHSLSQNRLENKEMQVPWNAMPVYPGFDPAMGLMYPGGYRGIGLDGARRKNATRETTSTLKAWLNDHRKNPYPTKAEKIMLAIVSKMTLTQVSTWFANARRRLKKENQMTWSPRNKPNEDRDSDDNDDVRDVQGTSSKDCSMNEGSHSEHHHHQQQQQHQVNDLSRAFPPFMLKQPDMGNKDNEHRGHNTSSEAGASTSLPQNPTSIPHILQEQQQMMLKHIASLPRSFLNTEAIRQYQQQQQQHQQHRMPMARPFLQHPAMMPGANQAAANFNQLLRHTVKPNPVVSNGTSPSSHHSLPNELPLHPKLRTNSVSSSSASASSHDHSPSPPFEQQQQQRMHQHLHHPYSMGGTPGNFSVASRVVKLSSPPQISRSMSSSSQSPHAPLDTKIKIELLSPNSEADAGSTSSESKKKSAKIWSPLDLPDRGERRSSAEHQDSGNEDGNNTDEAGRDGASSSEPKFPRPFVSLDRNRKYSHKSCNKDSPVRHQQERTDSPTSSHEQLSPNGAPPQQQPQMNHHQQQLPQFPAHFNLILEEYQRRLRAAGNPPGHQQQLESNFHQSLAVALRNLQSHRLTSSNAEQAENNGPNSHQMNAPSGRVENNRRMSASPPQCNGDPESHVSSDSESNVPNSTAGIPMNLSKAGNAMTPTYNNSGSDVEEMASNGKTSAQLQSIAAT